MLQQILWQHCKFDTLYYLISDFDHLETLRERLGIKINLHEWIQSQITTTAHLRSSINLNKLPALSHFYKKMCRRQEGGHHEVNI